MKKWYTLSLVLVLGTHVGISQPMFARLTKKVSGLYEKFFASAPRKPTQYQFYAPRESYSYFSPQFNMYHYVGIDYSGNNSHDNITNYLKLGVRGFIMPVVINDKFLSVVNTNSPLQHALAHIADFSEFKNEIVIVHLKNTKTHEKRIEALLKNRTIEPLIFKPADRFKDIEKNAAKTRIERLAHAEHITLWPRLTWNYAHKKLIMITWDSQESSDYCWKYNDYFTSDLSNTEKLITQKTVSIESAGSEVPVQHPTIFYSDVLRAELITGLGITTSLAMLMMYNYFNASIPQIGAPAVAQQPETSIAQLTEPSGEDAAYKQEYDTVYKQKYDEYYRMYYNDQYDQEHNKLLKQVDDPAITQKEHEYARKLFEQRYGTEVYGERQRIANLGRMFEDSGRSAHYDLSAKIDQWQEAVKMDARKMAIKDSNPLLAERLAKSASAIAKQSAMSLAAYMAEGVAKNLANKAMAVAATTLKPLAQKTVHYFQNNLSAVYYSQLLGYGAMTLTALAALGIYTTGTTKNLFTVVKKENVPAYPFGIFLTRPITQADINLINSAKNTIFHAVSEQNRGNFTVINNFQRSFLMTIADRARRLVSSLKK